MYVPKMADLQTKKPKKPENRIHMEMFQCVPTWTAVKSPWLHLIQVMAMHTKCIVKLVVPLWLNFITCVYAKLIRAFEFFHNVCKLGYQFLAVVRFSVRYYDVNDRLRWPSFQHRPNMKWNITIGTLVNSEPKDFQFRTATSVVPSCISCRIWHHGHLWNRKVTGYTQPNTSYLFAWKLNKL